MKKVLILANNDVGLYKFRKELIQELIDLKYQVYLSLPNGKYVDALIGLGCSFIETQMERRGTNPIYELDLVKKYHKIIKQIKPDVVLTYTIKPNIYGGIICRFTKVPYITNITGLGTVLENQGILQKISTILYRIALRNAYCVFFQNNKNMNFFYENSIVKDNTKLVPGSGVNLKEFTYHEYPPDNEIRFVFIGRLMKDKGINEFLTAAKKVKESYPEVNFDLIGDSEDDYSLIINQMEQKKIIKYHGFQDNIRQFIVRSHAIVLPSYHEGTANVLLEAAATGRPIIASNISGCKETFDDNLSGIGFEPKNADDLITAMIKFINIPYDQKKQMGIEGRKKMELEYNRQIVINSYIAEIKKIFK